MEFQEGLPPLSLVDKAQDPLRTPVLRAGVNNHGLFPPEQGVDGLTLLRLFPSNCASL